MLTLEPRNVILNAKPQPVVSTRNMPDPFVFVPVTQGEAAKGRGAAKRIVRAHVTRIQHAKSSTVNGMDLQTWTVKPYVHRDSVHAKRKPRLDAGERRRALATQSEKLKRSPEQQSTVSTPSPDVSSKPLPLPRMVDNGAEDPFWSFPVDYQPAISPIFAHYVQNIAVDIAELDGPGQKGLLRRELFPLCMTEAATMYAVLLMGASHYCVTNPSKASLIDLLAIKARALTEINKALANPKKATEDAIIMAVAKMAAYESIFGESDVFSAHMRGLQMMLKLKGGLPSLGLNGLLERMIVWIDLNACHLTGMACHLGTPDHPTAVWFEAPDPFHFAGIQ